MGVSSNLYTVDIAPKENVVLSQEQVLLILEHLKRMRHDINNHLAVIMASAELIRQKPGVAEKFLPSLTSKPTAITDAIKAFSADLEKLLQGPKA